jgi:outer membrane protein TolC
MMFFKQLLKKLGSVTFLSGVTLLLFASACMTPTRANRETEEVAHRLATIFWQVQTGRTNNLDLSRPADALTLRVALQAMARGEESVVFPAIPNMAINLTNGSWRLTLSEALNVGARNDRAYQSLKESVFSSALDLDSQLFRFDTTFSGMLVGALSDNVTDSDPRLAVASGAAVERQLESGTVLAGNLALDVSRLLSSDWSSLGIIGDLSMSIPLLRGAGREIVREPLTQAERQLTYAIRKFEYYRQTYAIAVTLNFYDVLEYAQRLKNAQDNERNLTLNSKRATMLFQAGRRSSIEADQATSQLLYARESVVAMKRSYDAKLDNFKILLGLPPEALIDVDPRALDSLRAEIQQSADEGTGGGRLFPDEEEVCSIALSNRLDLINTRDKLADAERAVKVAEDMLRADVTIVGQGETSRSVALNRVASDSGGEGWRLSLRADWPWNRRVERNNYKDSLLALEQTQREIHEKEDTVKLAARNGLRNLAAAESTYKIRLEGLRVAKIRVESTAMFMEAGRVIMRDVLEAQKALLTAQDDFCAAVISWRMRELELRRDMGILEISDANVWLRTARLKGLEQ